MNEPEWLIIGGAGTIGGALCRLARADHVAYLATCLPSEVLPGAVHLDLAAPVLPVLPSSLRAGFICAAIPSVAACESDPAATVQVNVESLRVLLPPLSERSVRVVYPSSDMVFDGTESHIPPDCPTSPATAYGRQKAAAEGLVREQCGSFGIVRFNKVLPPLFPLFEQWIGKLSAGIGVSAFDDMVISPITSDMAARALRAVARAEQSGTWHYSATDEMSYYDVARFFARRLGVSEDLVSPSHARDAGVTYVRRHSVLDNSQIGATLGVRLCSALEAIHDYWQGRKHERTP